jgi:hypothetical protein
MKKYKILLVSVIMVLFMITAAYATKSWKNINIEDCAISGGTIVNVAETKAIKSKTSDYTITAAETGSVFDNYGATATSVVLKLPEWAAGLTYTAIVTTTQSSPLYGITIEPTDTAHIIRLTDKAGDKIWADLAGESITLVATGVSTWTPREFGTWTDAD